ncbi:hypothetical protein AAIE21_06315 [Paenibacillus sp. 102]|uniref:hypothetical protein n=1 Tax=Paenibacillus sp. 102 TaxID=3120823 RepID=UPI0031BA14B1
MYTGRISNDFLFLPDLRENNQQVKELIGTEKEKDTKLTVQLMTGMIELKRDK